MGHGGGGQGWLQGGSGGAHCCMAPEPFGPLMTALAARARHDAKPALLVSCPFHPARTALR